MLCSDRRRVWRQDLNGGTAGRPPNGGAAGWRENEVKTTKQANRQGFAREMARRRRRRRRQGGRRRRQEIRINGYMNQ